MAMKRVELMNPVSCLNSAEPDEPVFVLRADDVNAPKTIRNWASHYFDEKGGWDKMSNGQRAKYCEALQSADDFESWKTLQGTRVMIELYPTPATRPQPKPERTWRHTAACFDVLCPGCRETL
jgi:hypothetical protein